MLVSASVQGDTGQCPQEAPGRWMCNMDSLSSSKLPATWVGRRTAGRLADFSTVSPNSLHGPSNSPFLLASIHLLTHYSLISLFVNELICSFMNSLVR